MTLDVNSLTKMLNFWATGLSDRRLRALTSHLHHTAKLLLWSPSHWPASLPVTQRHAQSAQVPSSILCTTVLVIHFTLAPGPRFIAEFRPRFWGNSIPPGSRCTNSSSWTFLPPTRTQIWLRISWNPGEINPACPHLSRHDRASSVCMARCPLMLTYLSAFRLNDRRRALLTQELISSFASSAVCFDLAARRAEWAEMGILSWLEFMPFSIKAV